MLFVIVNQIAYTVVVRLASGGTAARPPARGADGTGYTVYAYGLPDRDGAARDHHGLARDRDPAPALGHGRRRRPAGLAGTLAGTLRTALAVVVPFALLLPVIAPDLANVIWGYGAAATTYDHSSPVAGLFGTGIVFFTVHYLMLRGFYALERTRTVFLIQCAWGSTNIVVAVLLVARDDAADTSPALVVAYSASYVVGSARVLPGAAPAGSAGSGPQALVRFLVRLLVAAAVSTAGRRTARRSAARRRWRRPAPRRRGAARSSWSTHRRRRSCSSCSPGCCG